MRRGAAILLLGFVLAGCSGSQQEHQFQREAECKNGLIHDQACEQQKNREARVSEAERANQLAREGERLKSEGR